MSHLFLPTYIGHRGLTEGVIENSLEALDAAYYNGFTCVESDVQLTYDHIPVMLHDETLKRTLGLCGKISDWRYNDIIEQLPPELKSKTPLPTLQQYMERLLHYGMMFDLEIKGVHENATDRENKEATHIILRYFQQMFPNAAHNSFVSSFEIPCIEEAHRLWPELQRGFLLHEWRDDWYDIIKAHECFAFIVNHEILTAERREQIAHKNLPLIVYTIDTAHDNERMHTLNVKHIITGNPAIKNHFL